MGRRRKIKCSKCGKALFFLPSGYDMAFTVICVDCGDPDSSKKKHKPIQTAAARFAKTKKGIRPDIHPTYFFRSPTEANIARIFETANVKWLFENRVFTFADRKIRPFQYLPDFEVTSGNAMFPAGLYEVKGWLDSESRGKLRLFRQKYPQEAATLTVILYRSSEKKNTDFCKALGFRVMYYDKLTDQFAATIPTWEG